MKRSRRTLALVFLCILAVSFALGTVALWWSRRPPPPGESLFLPGENAFCPLPSPDGTSIAFVRVGWSRGTFGTRYMTDVCVADARGRLRHRAPVAPNMFLCGWEAPGERLVCVMDGKQALVTPGIHDVPRPSPWSALEMAQWQGEIGWHQVPSPDGTRVASFRSLGAQGVSFLRVRNAAARAWVEIGEIVVSQATEWEWMGGNWSPWSHDGSEIAFVSSTNEVVVASPDGRVRKSITRPESPAGLATLSPEGRHVAFVTHAPGNKRVWIARNRAGARAVAVTRTSPEPCFNVKWLGDSALLFDRIGGSPDNARIFRVQLDPAILGED